MTVFGAIGRDNTLTMPGHLGLVQAQEDSALVDQLAALADLVERDIDLAALQAAACPTRRQSQTLAPRPVPPGQRIALAQDVAFSFIYPHLVAGWRAAGAEIIPFSPLADEAPDPSCDVAWLPGGYPELHAGKLAAASRFAAGISAFALTRPVHGECGGYTTLGSRLRPWRRRRCRTNCGSSATGFWKPASAIASLPIRSWSALSELDHGDRVDRDACRHLPNPRLAFDLPAATDAGMRIEP